jgi:hypothetical protein
MHFPVDQRQEPRGSRLPFFLFLTLNCDEGFMCTGAAVGQKIKAYRPDIPALIHF